MTTPSIGGKVLDASTVAAFVQDSISVQTWLHLAKAYGTVLYLPLLAIVEVRAVRPDAGAKLGDLIGHPQVVREHLDPPYAAAVSALLDRLGKFDALAGQVVHVARQRGWPVLTADPGRLQRLDPTLEADMV